MPSSLSSLCFFSCVLKQALPNAPCANKLWAIVMAAMIVLVMRKETRNRGRSASFLVAFMALLFVFAFTSLVLQSSFLQHCSCFENSMEEKVEAIHNTAWRSNNKIETESKMKSMELAHLASHDSAPLKHVHQNDDSMVHRSEGEFVFSCFCSFCLCRSMQEVSEPRVVYRL